MGVKNNRNHFVHQNALRPNTCYGRIGQQTKTSWPQIQIQKYGIIYLNDFFYGDKLFELLADFQHQEWRQIYQDAVE